MDFCQPLSLCQPFLGHLLKHNTDSSQWIYRSRNTIIETSEIIFLLPKIRLSTDEHLLLFVLRRLCEQNPPANEEESANLSRPVVILRMLRFLRDPRNLLVTKRKTRESLMRQINLVSWNLYKRSAVRDCLAPFCARRRSAQAECAASSLCKNRVRVLCGDL